MEYLCTHEKQWLKCKDATRKQFLKTVFIESRKRFDRSVQKCKRQYWNKVQSDLLESCNKTPTEFWKTIGKIGVVNARNDKIPMETVQQDGSVSNSFNQILDKWKSTFEKLYTSEKEEQSYNITEPPSTSDDQSALSNGIDILEVEKAVKSLNKNKATGHDELPAEVIQSPACINYLHKLFSVCFENGTIPKMWTADIIHPVLKDPVTDKRDPLNYRGITVTSSVYKAYCQILNNRLSKWTEDNNIISDTQNGFRKHRSTIDHLSSLTNIIECRKKMGKST